MFTNARNPRWADENHTAIALDILFEGEAEYVPFVASHDDCTTHGPMLYNFALNGLFGPIGDSDEERILRGELPPPEGFEVIGGAIVNVAAITEAAEAELNRRLAELSTEEAKARAEIDDEYAANRKKKIMSLLAVKQQPHWPLEVTWPD